MAPVVNTVATDAMALAGVAVEDLLAALGAATLFLRSIHCATNGAQL